MKVYAGYAGGASFEVADLRRLGRELERTVLARAVKWHLEDRILVYENRTVVFSD